jgi:thiamine biosynthesis lipoprotein
MKDTRPIMGMPITVEVVSAKVSSDLLDEVFAYFTEVDERFSTYKETSEISKINKKIITEISDEMKEVFEIADRTRQETNGYFDIKRPDGSLDPSGIVKGWAIKNAAELLQKMGVTDFFVEAGGDIQASGKNPMGEEWAVGIRNPFKTDEIVKVIFPRGKGVATSGSYERGNHIYNPLSPGETLDVVKGITVVGPDVLEADRFATAAFAMGTHGVQFIESMDGFEAYSIDKDGIATMTSGFLTLTK